MSSFSEPCPCLYLFPFSQFLYHVFFLHLLKSITFSIQLLHLIESSSSSFRFYFVLFFQPCPCFCLFSPFSQCLHHNAFFPQLLPSISVSIQLLYLPQQTLFLFFPFLLQPYFFLTLSPFLYHKVFFPHLIDYLFPHSFCFSLSPCPYPSFSSS